MKLRRLALLTSLTAIGALGAVGTAPAIAAPVWNLDLHHNETNFAPGVPDATPEYWFDVSNVGDAATSGPITLTVNLPTGLSRDSVRLDNGTGGGTAAWSCPGSPGDTTLTCTTTDSILRHSLSRNLVLTVDVAPGAGPDLLTTATLSGGGASEAPPAAGCPPEVGACASEPTHVSSDPAPFGIVDGSWVADFYEADGLTPDRRSGAHPDLATFSLDFNSVDAGLSQEETPQKAAFGNVRHVTVDLPPGFIGNPSAVGECTPSQLPAGACPASSMVGRADLSVFPITNTDRLNWTTPIFNMSHPLGVVTDLAFQVAGNPIHIKVSIDPANNYSVRATAADINETVPPFNSKVTVWGVPGDSSHDFERRGPTGQTVKPFLTLPFDCGVDNSIKLSRYDSWQNTGVFGPDIEYHMPGRQTDCDDPRFEPSVDLEPTGKQANTPTGLDVHIHVPQNGNPGGLGTPPVQSTVVTLPEGMTVSPSFADGLAGCSQAQIGLETDKAVACPDNSRIGEVDIRTPLLPQPIEGSLYLAKQGENPYGTLLAFYLAVHDTEGRGILVKVPGRVDLDPVSGQITGTFKDLPQIPFEDFTVKFRSGPRAPLNNPPTCGSHAIAVRMTSWAQPDEAVAFSNSYQVTEGAGGGACQNVASLRPFDPLLLGGTINPLAGAFSPLALRFTRTDAEQELSHVEGTAPKGLLASLRGVGRCSEAQVAAAKNRNEPGDGNLEFASPSCPADSQVGTVEAGLGGGSALIYVPGKIYLAGPYKGAPLSGVAIVPGVAGPVDVGNVVVRAPAYIDPVTAQIRIATDKLPQIVHGVLVRVRDIRVRLDRPNFIVNPTNCEPKNIDAMMFSVEGATRAALSRFQVGDCASLGFKPKLSLKLNGGTKRGDHPALKSVVTTRPGDANFDKVVVTLPKSAFLDQSHIRTICTRVQYAARSCPAAAQYGYARAWSPLLDETVEGPVYLRSSNHKLPDLVAALHGIVDVDVVGRIDSFKGGIRSSFEEIPDVPVTRFELTIQGGRKGLVVNSRNLCKGVNRADAKFVGQNGRPFNARPVMRPSCGGKKSGGRGRG